jgi:hypothetical protein
MELILEKIKSGEIRVGLSLEEVKTILGEPTDWGSTSRKYKMPMIYRWGKLEFAFTPARNKHERQFLVYVMDENHTFYLSDQK